MAALGARTDTVPPEESGSFATFIDLVKSVTAEGSHGAKTEIIRNYLSDFTGNVYLFFKLLLCKEDKRVYNIRDKNMVKVLAGVLKQSAAEMRQDLDNGDVSETARKFFEATGRAPTESTLTLHDVDAFLEEFVSVTRAADQAAIFTRICAKATPLDLMYLVRILNHDLKAYCGARYALAALHPQAFEAFKNNSNLQLIVSRCLGRSKSSAAELAAMVAAGAKPAKGGAKKLKTGLSLFNPIKPMLAKACKSVEEAIKRHPEGLYSEIKYDGERLQIHKDGDQFTFFSRNLKSVPDWKTVEVKEFIPRATSAESIILDSEILCIDKTTGVPLPFIAFNKNKRADYPNAQVCIFVFDIIYLNGESLLNTPINERREILEGNLTIIPNRVMLSQLKEVHHEDDLADLMNQVLETGLEGLVLKGVNTLYEPNARHWLKIKKDYLLGGGMADSADLVVIGGFFGSGAKGGLITTFLMGCYDRDTGRWKTCCKCGSGFDDATLDRLQETVVPLMIKVNGDYDLMIKEAPWLDIDRYHKPAYIIRDPKEGPVWEIMGAEFSYSPHHTANNISIRFPRLARMRDDKTWKSATALQELVALEAASKPGGAGFQKMTVKGVVGGGGNKRKRTEDSASSSEAPKAKKPRAAAPAAALASSPSPPPNSEVVIEPVGVVTHVRGDVTAPVAAVPGGNRVIVHCVDDSGRWGRGGVFSAISKVSPAPAQNYEACKRMGKFCDMGDIQLVVVPSDTDGQLFVCSVICQKSTSAGVPPFDAESFETGLDKLLEKAAQLNASVHMAAVRDGVVPNLTSTGVTDCVKRVFTNTRVPVYVYTYASGPPSLCADQPDAADSGASAPTDDGPPPLVKSRSGVLALPAEPFSGVVAVFDNVPNPMQTATIILNFGGGVQDSLTGLGEGGTPSTHVITTTPDSELAVNGASLGLTVVSPDWVNACYESQTRVSEKEYIVVEAEVGAGSDDVAGAELTLVSPRVEEDVDMPDVEQDKGKQAADSEENDDDGTVVVGGDKKSTTLTDSTLVVGETPTATTTTTTAPESEPVTDKKESIPVVTHAPFLEGVVVFVYGTVDEGGKLEEAIERHGGRVETRTGSKELTHIVTESDWNMDVQKMFSRNSNCRVVRPGWVWDCVQKGKRAYERPFFVARP